ncbi:MAG: 50S ribosomal protein L22 [Bacteroidota bacterium]
MEARAKQTYIRISPRKMRIVADAVRGKKVTEAIDTLHFLPQKATRFIQRTIESAYANLHDQNTGVDDEALIVKTIFVDEAPVFKRFRPVSRGRAHPILKRQSHLTVVIGTPDGAAEAE